MRVLPVARTYTDRVENDALPDFRSAIAGPAAEVDLLGASLAIAAIGRSRPAPELVEDELAGIASAVLRLAGQGADSAELAQAVDHQLFSTLGFQGATDSWDVPENSYVDRVLERRRGIPISLALVYMEVARRAGLVCRGVGFPGHFLVVVGESGQGYYVDPFHQGARVDREELCARLAGMELGPGRPEMFLEPVTPRQMIQRMLGNLRTAFRRSGRIREWHEAIEYSLVLEPWTVSLMGERGMARYRLGDLPAALGDLERYVDAQQKMSVGAMRFLDELRLRIRDEGLR